MLRHTILYHTIPLHTIPYIPYHTYHTVLYCIVLYYTILYNTIPYYTILYYTIPYHTIPYYMLRAAPRNSPNRHCSAATSIIVSLRAGWWTTQIGLEEYLWRRIRLLMHSVWYAYAMRCYTAIRLGGVSVETDTSPHA